MAKVSRGFTRENSQPAQHEKYTAILGCNCVAEYFQITANNTHRWNPRSSRLRPRSVPLKQSGYRKGVLSYLTALALWWPKANLMDILGSNHAISIDHLIGHFWLISIELVLLLNKPCNELGCDALQTACPS